MAPKRKPSDQPSAVDSKKPRVTFDSVTSSLVPVGERKMAKKGVVDTEMLRMLCEDRKKDNERKELHFKKILRADIDWNNKLHIDKINAWRLQIYGRAGMKNKTVLLWHQDEMDWIELYWQLHVVEANKRGIRAPKPKTSMESFNAFFNGKVFPSSSGEELEPRGDRNVGPFSSKTGRLVKMLRPYLEKKLIGKEDGTFFPKITQDMLDDYQKLKSDLASLGCNDEKVIPWEEVEDESNSKDYVIRCRNYIASLPDQEDIKMTDEEKEEEEEDMTLVEDEELDKELLELATGPEEVSVESKQTEENRTCFALTTESASSSREAAPFNTLENKTSAVTGIASQHQQAERAASVNSTVKEASSDLTFAGEEVQDHVISGNKEVVQAEIGIAESEAAAALLSMYHS